MRAATDSVGGSHATAAAAASAPVPSLSCMGADDAEAAGRCAPRKATTAALSSGSVAAPAPWTRPASSRTCASGHSHGDDGDGPAAVPAEAAATTAGSAQKAAARLATHSGAWATAQPRQGRRGAGGRRQARGLTCGTPNAQKGAGKDEDGTAKAAAALAVPADASAAASATPAAAAAGASCGCSSPKPQ